MILFVSRLKRNTFGFSRGVYETERERERYKKALYLLITASPDAQR